ncbi:MAG: S8 family peptidase [Nocardioidaceae bacterium]|nr:S8 family peptidase [Nocardioidaceae bacterium]
MSQYTRRASRGRKILTVAAAGTMLAVSVGAGGSSAFASKSKVPSADGLSSAAKAQSFTDGKYVVVMAQKPAATYRGGVSGFARTAPTGGRTFDSTTAASRDYIGSLKQQQDRLAGAVGANPLYNYTTALNGFAASLSGEQASELSRRSDVLAVVKSRLAKPDVTPTADFLGLTGKNGVWKDLGGKDSSTGAGKGTIIGVVDSGINSDSKSFAATGGKVPGQWTGICQKSDDSDFAANFNCNDKLIGGRYYNEGYGPVFNGEFRSPEDFGGHGSHTASTAAGNSGVNARIKGDSYGTITGMAPAARVASYKVCWEEKAPDEGGCSTLDSVAAIDDAVKDGVDAINFSISGSDANPIDPVEIAFLNAADAGVFVAASAGNSGPTPSTVNHPSPWLTTVAATTHELIESTVKLGNGDSYVGASSAVNDVPSSPLVSSYEIASDESDGGVADAKLCFPDSLDPAEADGKIVICDRGTNARVEKSDVVKAAGGVGMLLINVPGGPDDTSAELHAVPTVHLRSEYSVPIHKYADTAAKPTASIDAGNNAGSTTPTPPALSGFSSRGPSLAADGDLLKPDIAAPGSDVLAAVAPENNKGRDFDFYSGTSMSSPHIAGLALLFKQRFPTWSPMDIKSAMMTTAVDLTDTKDPFDQGAGFVAPRKFFNPGLSFDSDIDDWLSYLAGQGITYGNGKPLSKDPEKASNMNTPSIAVNKLAGKETVVRKVTNVSNKKSTYTMTDTGLSGVKISASPSQFSIAPGKTQKITLTLKRTDAKFGKYAKGRIFFKDGTHSVRIPIVVNPTALQAPPEVTPQVSAEGSDPFFIKTKAGFDGTVKARVKGLVEGDDTEGTATGPNTGDLVPDDPKNFRQDLKVTDATTLVRVQILPDDSTDDLDLFITDDADDSIVAASATGRADEIITTRELPPGDYTVHVVAYSVADGTDASFTLRDFVVEGDEGNLTADPPQRQVETGETYSWKFTPDNTIDDTAPYLGMVNFRGMGKTLARTVVSLNE